MLLLLGLYFVGLVLAQVGWGAYDGGHSEEFSNIDAPVKVFSIVFWPILLAVVVVAALFVGPYRLGRRFGGDDA